MDQSFFVVSKLEKNSINKENYSKNLNYFYKEIKGFNLPEKN